MNASRPVATVDSSIQDLVPQYLESRKKDVLLIRESLKTGDWKKIEAIGHNLKGVAASYGFTDLQALGADMERQAREHRVTDIETLTARLDDYLSTVEIRYVEDPT